MQFAQTEVSRAQSKVDELKATKERQLLQSLRFNEADLTTAEKALNQLNERFGPYRSELDRRIGTNG